MNAMTSKTRWVPIFNEDFIRYNTKKDPWIATNKLKDKDDWEDSRIEYGVVREGSHGQKSWGWGDGKDKIILFGNMQLPSKLPQLKQICIDFATYLNEIKY